MELESDNKANINEELTYENSKWLIDDPGRTPENFPLLRYYVHRFKGVPSVTGYTGSIEAYFLLDELKNNMGAEVVHSYSTIYSILNERMHRYTLSFRQGYVLHASSINDSDSDEYVVPAFMEESDTRIDYDYLYFGNFQLLRPGDGSGKRDKAFEEELNKYIRKCTLRKIPDKPFINMIEQDGKGFSMEEHAVDENFEIKDLNVNYGHGFLDFHNELMGRFNNSTKGLVLFHGLPGTGKTYYIRHLLRTMAGGNKEVIYMPPNMVDHLVEPAFMTFLVGEVKRWSEEGKFCVLLIEDAEPLLAKRQEGVRIQGVTNLLNMTDGLLNDMLNLQIICTFNVELKKIDSALLRPGRLIARKEFKALSELDTNLLAQRLGIKHHFTKGATLGEIYSKLKDKKILIHNVEAGSGASTAMDDLD